MLIIVTLMYMNLKFKKINSKNIITLKIKLKIILLFIKLFNLNFKLKIL